MDFKLNFDVACSIPTGVHVIGVLHMKNKCCKNKHVLITQTNELEVYSCQCACGGWCTNGHKHISDAIREYEKMSN